MLAHCDAIKSFVKRPRSPRRLQHVSVRKKVCHIVCSSDHLLKCGEVSRGNSTEENEVRGVEAGDLIQQEDMEDQLTIRELLTSAKHNSEEIVESPSASTKEIETLAKMEANMKPGEVNVESSVQDKKHETLENISEAAKIGFTVAIDVPRPLSVGKSQNLPTFIAGKDVKKIKSEVKQDAEVTRNESSIGESKGVVTDEVKSKPGLKDGGEGSNTHDLLTLGLQLEARICRLEKLFSELKD